MLSRFRSLHSRKSCKWAKDWLVVKKHELHLATCEKIAWLQCHWTSWETRKPSLCGRETKRSEEAPSAANDGSIEIWFSKNDIAQYKSYQKAESGRQALLLAFSLFWITWVGKYSTLSYPTLYLQIITLFTKATGPWNVWWDSGLFLDFTTIVTDFSVTVEIFPGRTVILIPWYLSSTLLSQNVALMLCFLAYTSDKRAPVTCT